MRGVILLEHVKSMLKDFRESAGLSQDELAEAIGVNRKTIIALESEAGADPKVSTVRRILAYLKISFEDLFPEGPNSNGYRDCEVR